MSIAEVSDNKLKLLVGLSTIFVIAWLGGDFFNLIGAVMASLQSTVVLLAVYVSLVSYILEDT